MYTIKTGTQFTNFSLKKKDLFIYLFERERDHVQAEREAEREEEEGKESEADSGWSPTWGTFS